MSILGRLVAALLVAFALSAAAAPAYAAGSVYPQPASAMTRRDRAKATRAALGGYTVGKNVGWGVATGALAVFSAVHGAYLDAAVLGGFSAYNLTQAYRKWKAERAANE
jgi:hypothetical protein